VFPELDVGQLPGDLGLALTAFVLALPVGWNRFKRNCPAAPDLSQEQRDT